MQSRTLFACLRAVFRKSTNTSTGRFGAFGFYFGFPLADAKAAVVRGKCEFDAIGDLARADPVSVALFNENADASKQLILFGQTPRVHLHMWFQLALSMHVETFPG